MRLHKTHELTSFKALENEEPGTFEAVVSVFGNVDLQGDRTMPGAFKRTLKSLREKGNPIPVIWSHDWLNPDAHIGYADPNDVSEIPITSKAAGITGGLLVRGHIDIHKPFAAQVFDLLKERRVREWSFAYDVVRESLNEKDGANELFDLDLHEIGPCLKGANPVTYTVGAKSAMETELKDAWEASRTLTKFVELIKTVDDPELANALTKSYLKPAPSRGIKRYHMEKRMPEYDGPYSLETDDEIVACIDNETDEAVDYHKTEEAAIEHIKRLEGGVTTPKMSVNEVRAALDLPPLEEIPEEEDMSDLEAAVADPVEKSVEPTMVNVVIDGYKFQVDPDALVLDEDEAELKTHGTAVIDESILEGPVVDEGKTATKPWHIEERGDEFCVIKDSDSSEAGCHPTREEAEAQLRALYANEAEKSADSDLQESEPVAESVADVTALSNSTTTTNGSNVGNLNLTWTGTASLESMIEAAVEKALAARSTESKTEETETESPSEWLERMLDNDV